MLKYEFKRFFQGLMITSPFLFGSDIVNHNILVLFELLGKHIVIMNP